MNYSSLMKESLKANLYQHCLGTANAAFSLAAHYGADENKANLAGLVHDYGKRYSAPELLRKADEHSIYLDFYTRSSGKLLHAPVGAALLKIEQGLDDPEVLRAVKYHTTGRRGMTLLEKILYLADYIEEGRRFDGVKEIRKAAFLNLDEALLLAVDNTISSVVRRGLLLHPRSVAFRNSLIVGSNK